MVSELKDSHIPVIDGMINFPFDYRIHQDFRSGGFAPRTQVVLCPCTPLGRSHDLILHLPLGMVMYVGDGCKVMQ